MHLRAGIFVLYAAFVSVCVPSLARFHNSQRVHHRTPKQPSAGQHSAKSLGGKPDRGVFPEVSKTLQEPDRIFQGMSSRFEAIGASIESMHQGKLAAIAQQQAEYEQKLNTQEHLIKALQSDNARSQRDITTSDHRNTLLRRRAEDVFDDVTLLREELGYVKSNMTIAWDFVAAALKQTSGASVAPDLEILRKLEKQDQDRHDKSLKRRRFDKIMSMGHKTSRSGSGASLLQVSSSHRLALYGKGRATPRNLETKPTVKPEDFIIHLQNNVEALTKRHEESAASLRHAFKEEFKNGTETFDHNLREQERLLKGLQQSQALGTRLLAAVTYLSNAHSYLVARIRSLRMFMRQMAYERPVIVEDVMSPDDEEEDEEELHPISLLQFDGRASSSTYRRLVSSELTNEPATVFRELNSDVHMFDQQLRSLEQERVGSTVDQRLDYEAQLQQKTRTNLRLANENQHLATEINSVVESIATLRSKAGGLKEYDAKLRVDLKGMQVNLSMSIEYAEKTLNSSRLRGVEELKVLKELDHEDQKEEDAETNEEMFKEIAHPSFLDSDEFDDIEDSESSQLTEGGVSLLALQTMVRPKRQPKKAPVVEEDVDAQDPTDLLKDMRHEMSKLNKAHETSDQKLKRQFDKAVSRTERLHNKLLREQDLGNTTLVASNQTKNQLMGAVQHLTNVQHFLETQSHSVRVFLMKLSRPGRELEAGAEQVQKEARSDGGTADNAPVPRQGKKPSVV